MPNLLASDAIAAARVQLNDPSPQGRWSNGSLLGFLDRANKLLNRDVLFPEARWVIPTVANQQEYQIDPPVIETLRVYCNGQLLTPTTLQLLEGHQIGLYDQSGTGAPPTGSGAPPGVQGTHTPQWVAQSPETYPVQSGSYGGLAPNTTPWFPGRRPSYYWRGGFLGLVPAPASAGSYLVLEGVAQTPSITTTTTMTQWPTMCLDALVWKMCELAMFSDNSSSSSEARNYAASMYDKEMRRIRTWNRRRDGDMPRTPVLRTNRSGYITGNNRFGSGGF
jgi:hypothetical protein